MMYPPADIEWVRGEIGKCGENMKRKHKFKEFSNAKLTFDEMEDTEPGYSRYDYVKR